MDAVVAKTTSAKKHFLKKAAHHANEGKIQESIALCKKYLDEFDGDAEIYHLLGTLHIADKNDELASYYLEKALYLDPNHYDALVSLALITERGGTLSRQNYCGNALESNLRWRRKVKMRTNHDP